MKNDTKFVEQLTCDLKNDMRNSEKFDPTLESLKICTLMGSFRATCILFELKKITEELCVMTLKCNTIFKERLIGGLKNGIRNLINFHASSRKSENLHFDGFVLSKAYRVLGEKVQNNYVSWHWRVIHKEKQILEKYAFCVWCNKFEAVSGRYT